MIVVKFPPRFQGGVILSNASWRVNRILGRSKLSAEKNIKNVILGEHKKGDFNVGFIDYKSLMFVINMYLLLIPGNLP